MGACFLHPSHRVPVMAPSGDRYGSLTLPVLPPHFLPLQEAPTPRMERRTIPLRTGHPQPGTDIKSSQTRPYSDTCMWRLEAHHLYFFESELLDAWLRPMKLCCTLLADALGDVVSSVLSCSVIVDLQERAQSASKHVRRERDADLQKVQTM